MPATRSVSLEELASMFSLPEKQCARQLGVCLTSLKKICRSHGISRWPYRKLKSIDKKLGKIENALTNSAEDPSAMLLKWEMLKLEKKNLPFSAAMGLSASASAALQASSAFPAPSSSSRSVRKQRGSSHSATSPASAVSESESRKRSSSVANTGAQLSAGSSPVSPNSAHASLHSAKRCLSSSSIASGAITPCHPDVGVMENITSNIRKRQVIVVPAPHLAGKMHNGAEHLSPLSACSSASESTVALHDGLHDDDYVEDRDCDDSSSITSSTIEDDDMVADLACNPPATSTPTPRAEPPRAAARHRPSELDMIGSDNLIPMGREDDLEAAHLAAREPLRTSRDEASSLMPDLYSARPDSARFSARGAAAMLETLPLVSPGIKDSMMDDLFPIYTEPLSASTKDFFQTSEESEFFLH